MDLRIHTSSDIDVYGIGLWLVSDGDRTVFRGNLYDCTTWCAEQAVAHGIERQQCEIHGDGCEVFTRCVEVSGVTACPTCACATAGP